MKKEEKGWKKKTYTILNIYTPGDIIVILLLCKTIVSWCYQICLERTETYVIYSVSNAVIHGYITVIQKVFNLSSKNRREFFQLLLKN